LPHAHSAGRTSSSIARKSWLRMGHHTIQIKGWANANQNISDRHHQGECGLAKHHALEGRHAFPSPWSPIVRNRLDSTLFLGAETH
jgi:hypothetical protein